MSTFVASQIRFTPDFSSFEMFGDDNNVFPKSNRWTKQIPLSDLLRELDGRTMTLPRSKYHNIHEALKEAQKAFIARFGELDWSTNQKSIWHWPYMVQENQVTPEDIIFFAKLEGDFITAIKGSTAPRKPVTYVAKNVSQIRLL